jgi:hypothetical protein
MRTEILNQTHGLAWQVGRILLVVNATRDVVEAARKQ